MVRDKIIVICGIGDNFKLMKLLTYHWRQYHGTIEIFRSEWHDPSTSLNLIIKRLTNEIESLRSKEYRVSLVGISAGGSLAVSTYCQHPHLIHRVITVGSCLHIQSQLSSQQQLQKYFYSHSYVDSLKVCEKGIPHLTIHQRQQIMTIRARYGDEIVPANSAILIGARNISVPCIEHRLSIGMALLGYTQTIVNFIHS